MAWQQPELTELALDALADSKGGRRGLALLQVGEYRRAERDLRGVAGQSDKKMAEGILALASRANMPALTVRPSFPSP